MSIKSTEKMTTYARIVQQYAALSQQIKYARLTMQQTIERTLEKQEFR